MIRNTTLAAIAATLIASSATAQTAIRFTLLESLFDNPVGGTILLDTGMGGTVYTDPAEIGWGDVAGALGDDDISGYRFDARATPFEEGPFLPFVLGDFTHFNQPISDEGISSVELLVRGSLDATTDGGSTYDPLGVRTFTFDITHNETPNNGNPCDSSAPTPNVGVNVNGCADEVTFAVNPFSESFVVNGEILTLNILGFAESVADANNGIFTTSFLSKEQRNNSRVLTASFTNFPVPPVEEVVPLPAGAALLPLGLAGIAALRARRRRNGSA